MAIRLARETLSLKSIVQDLNTKVKTYTNNTDYASDSVKDLRKKLNEANESFDDYVDKLNDASDEEKDLLKATNNMINGFEDLGKELGVKPEELDDYVDSLIDAEDTSDFVKKALSNVGQETKNALAEAADYFTGEDFKTDMAADVNAELARDFNDMVTQSAALCDISVVEMNQVYDNFMAELK